MPLKEAPHLPIMTSKEEVSRFLDDFKVKMGIYDVVYTNRVKNLQALADLDIRPFERTAFLRKLSVESY